MKIVLASASERRVELLKRLVEDFDVIVSDFDESNIKLEGSITKYVEDIACGKAKDVAMKMSNDSIIIAADTVVVFNEEVLGKPTNKTDAFNMLTKLSGNTHEVYTSVVVINKAKDIIIKSTESTKVKFSKLSNKEIERYIDTNEPMDKAGSYGIQGYGGAFVESINGCYYNVVGLPLSRLRKILLEII